MLSESVMHIILTDTIRIYYLASRPLVLITFLPLQVPTRGQGCANINQRQLCIFRSWFSSEHSLMTIIQAEKEASWFLSKSLESSCGPENWKKYFVSFKNYLLFHSQCPPVISLSLGSRMCLSVVWGCSQNTGRGEGTGNIISSSVGILLLDLHYNLML